MPIPELETALQEALERHKKALKALNLKECFAAHDALLQAERALAAAKGEPYAVPLDFPVRWDIGAPLPHLLRNDSKAFVIFFLRDVDPNWDGTYVKVPHLNSQAAQGLAVVEFKLCVWIKMGAPNDEVFRGHPLYGRGFSSYRAMAVENSDWLKEHEKINSVHSKYRPKGCCQLKHYIFPFHDSTLECIAEGFTVETFQTGLPQLLSEISRRLIQ